MVLTLEIEAARISKLEAEKKENQKVVEVIIDVIRHISLQNEAFRQGRKQVANFGGAWKDENSNFK